MAVGDSGRLIPHAKKHDYKKSEKREILGLGYYWPEPDWEELVEYGLRHDVCARLYAVYHNLRRKPRTKPIFDITPEEWEESYSVGINVFRTIFESVTTLSDAKKIGADFAQALGIKDHKEAVKLIQDEEGKNNPNVRAYWSVGRGESRVLKSPVSLTLRLSLYADYLHLLGFPETDAATKYKIFPFENTMAGCWELWRIQSGDDRQKIEGEAYASKEDALTAIRDILATPAEESNVSLPQKPLSNIKVRKADKIYEVENKSSPETLIQDFYIAGVQFGESLSGVQRKAWVESTYDALMDLSRILSFKSTWIGGKRLTMAFGSRKANGNAVAHYEPDYFCISMTRQRGVGSLAHEYAHHIDHRFGSFVDTQMLSSNPYLTSKIQFTNPDQVLRDFNITPGKEALVKTMADFLFYVSGSDFYSRSRKINALPRSGGYWSEAYELWARCFESAIQDILVSLGFENQMLVHGTRPQDYDVVDLEHFPYPIGEERIEIVKRVSAVLSSV